VVGSAPQRSAVITAARELIAFARTQGYGRSELVEIIEGVS
jgi:hypothetical protein